MMKSYLRYEPEKLFGVIASPTCNLAFDSGGNLAISGGVHEVNVWNIRQGSQIAQLKDKVDSGYPFTPVGEVTAVAPSPDKKSIAVGYSTGEVKIFDYVQQTLLTTLRGHRSAVTCLVYDDLDEHGGLVLASGGADCDVFLWDLVANIGLARLRGHKDAITGIGFLRSNSRQNILVSASKDTQLKVWDIDTRFCIQTILGHRSEIWSLAVIKPRPKENPHAFRVLTGCTDDQIRGYRVKLASRHNNGNNNNDGDEGTDMLLDDDETVLEYYGSVMRCAPKSTVTERCAHIATNDSGSLIGTQAGKTFDVFRMRDVDDIKRKLKKRLRKGRKQAEAAAGGDGEGWGEDEDVAMKVDNNDDEDDEDDEEEDEDDRKKSQLGDELEYLTTVRGSAKLRGSAFRPGNHSGKDKETVLLSLVTNSFEMFDVSVARQTQERTAPTKSLVLDLHGHRSDVRSVVVSEDGQTIASCSSEGVKIWSASSFTCMRSCACGYGIALAFAPGSKYLVVGTKEGAVQIVDVASGEIIMSEESVHAGPVWAVAMRPDGKGFVTGGADKYVRMWEFEVSTSGTVGGATTITASVARQLQMTRDVLSLRYNYAKAANKLLLCVGLLDSTIKVFFEDSLKFFLSLYGHSLPVLSMDVSDDTRILASGSADKTIKLWGLDFGDCHRSLSGHADSVTSIRFQPHTHYFFSASKDGAVKYWDADRFEQILSLPGHKGPVWGLDLPQDASYCVSVGQDRSLRVWRRGEDLVFVEEEKERALEALADRAAGDDGYGKNKPSKGEEGNNNDGVDKDVVVYEDATAAANAVGSRSVDSVRGGEAIMEALDVAEAELADIAEYEAVLARTKNNMKKRTVNPVLLGATPHMYMITQLRRVKQPDLEQALLIIPFDYVVRMVRMLIALSKLGLDLELCCRASVFLLRCHFPQITSSRVLVPEILELRDLIRENVGSFRDLIGTNLAAVKHIKRSVADKAEDFATIPSQDPEAESSNKRRR